MFDLDEKEKLKMQMRVLVDLYAETNNNVIDLADYMKKMTKEMKALTKLYKNLSNCEK